MTEQAEPSPRVESQPAGLRRPAGELSDTAREAWGYIVWGLMALVIAVFEIWAVIGAPPWPTISATVGHLEAQWNFVALIVVALIVVAADQTSPSARAAREKRMRPKTGRFTMSPAPTANQFPELSPYFYFPVALGIVIGGAWWIISASNDKWVRGYVIYGLIAVLFMIIPSVMAAFFRTDVPFPTLFRTTDYLERHWHAAPIVILIGLVILLIHLAFYPWPHIVKPPTTGSP